MLLKETNEQKVDISPFTKQALFLRNKIYQMQIQIAKEVLKVKKVEARLEEISVIASQFRDKTQNAMEIIQGILTWLETTKDPPANTPFKYSERMQLEFELIGFGNKSIERLLEAIKKTKNQCMEFCEKVLTTYNRCQTSSKRRLNDLPPHEEHLQQLQARFQED